MNKALTFFALYVAQSIPMSLISTLLPVLMRQGEFSLTTIGMLQLIKLPWILKLLWAPLVDRHTSDLKSYKRWIWASEIAYALCILAVAFLSLEVHFELILCLVVLAFVASATQDIATDALTSRAFGGDNISANRLQSMGQFAGTLIGGGLLMMLYRFLGWTPLFILMACLVLILLIPLQFYRRELATDSQSSEVISGKSIGWGDIISFFAQREAPKRCGLLLLFNAGLVGTMAMMKPYLVDLSYSLQEIGLLFSIYGACCGFVASWLAGRYLRRMPRPKALRLSAMFIAFASGLIALVAHLGLFSLGFVMLSLMALWGAYGLGTVMIYALAMDYVRPGREGTDFTLQIVLLHLSSVVVASLSGKLSQSLGYTMFFTLEFGLSLLALLYAYRFTDDRPNQQIQ